MGSTARPSVVSQNVWGPDAWDLIHALSFVNAPVVLFVIALETLPCETCRKHAKKILKDSKAALEEHKRKDMLVDYWFHFHNKVNKRLGKSYSKFVLADLCNKYALRGTKVLPLDVFARYARAQWLFTPTSIRNEELLVKFWKACIQFLKLPVVVTRSTGRALDLLHDMDPFTKISDVSMALETDD